MKQRAFAFIRGKAMSEWWENNELMKEEKEANEMRMVLNGDNFLDAVFSVKTDTNGNV